MRKEKETLADKKQIILVDENDKQIGVGEKLKIHQQGRLHRAFSVIVFNKQGKLLLQKRAKNKYHCPGLWSNTCCSHPKPGEGIEEAAHRRLKEELGFDCPLKKLTAFYYRAEFDNGLIENEIDHLFQGTYDGPVNPNPAEVAEIQWQNLATLKKDITTYPYHYTPWLKIIIKSLRTPAT